MSLSASINYSSFPDSAQMLLPTPPPSISTSRPPPRQIHRNRASYSCHSCRRRKVKCDRQHPTCGNCSKNGELCVFADNTGKGAANKKNKGSPTKRTRTGQFPGSDDGSSDGFRSASHSRSSSYNQSDFSGSFSGSPFMDTQVSPQMIQFPFPPAQLPPAEIETRATKLAEIMDHWYRVYSQTEHQPHDLPPDLKSVVGAFPKTPQVDRWPTGHIIPEDSQSRSFISKSREQENFAPQTQARATECLTHAQKDGNGDDVAMGYLSIQDDGQSRYVGTSFWALLSNEVNKTAIM